MVSSLLLAVTGAPLGACPAIADSLRTLILAWGVVCILAAAIPVSFALAIGPCHCCDRPGAWRWRWSRAVGFTRLCWRCHQKDYGRTRPPRSETP